jgi:hypothetical protein
MESTVSSFDRREFRNALGSFATGVHHRRLATSSEGTSGRVL